jgi:hypothetical protein
MPGETVLLVNPSRRRRRRNPKARRRGRRRNMFVPVGRVARTNPRRRRRRNPMARRYRRNMYRRNPNGILGANFRNLLTDATWGAAGALTVNAIINHAPLPLALKAGYGGFAFKGLTAVMLGTFGRRMGLGANASKMALGLLTVVMTDLIRVTLAPMVPAINLSGLGFYSPAMLATRPSLPGNANQAGRMGNVTSLAGAKVGNGKLGMFVAGRGR